MITMGFHGRVHGHGTRDKRVVSTTGHRQWVQVHQDRRQIVTNHTIGRGLRSVHLQLLRKGGIAEDGARDQARREAGQPMGGCALQSEVRHGHVSSWRSQRDMCSEKQVSRSLSLGHQVVGAAERCGSSPA